jgi:hypothetical protein
VRQHSQVCLALCRFPKERAKVAFQLKLLIAPAGMGETFQVLIASRGVFLGSLAGQWTYQSAQFSLLFNTPEIS